MAFRDWIHDVMHKPDEHAYAQNPQAYWTWRGRNYDAERGRLGEFRLNYEHGEAILEDLLRGVNAKHVLEVGCGTGRLFPIYERVGADFVGVDFSPSMIEQSSRKAPGRVLFGDVTKRVPLPGGFDVVVASEVLLHVPPMKVRNAVRELCRLSSRHVVLVDNDTSTPMNLNSHVFRHDYESMFEEHGFELAKRNALPQGTSAVYHFTKEG